MNLPPDLENRNSFKVDRCEVNGLPSFALHPLKLTREEGVKKADEFIDIIKQDNRKVGKQAIM